MAEEEEVNPKAYPLAKAGMLSAWKKVSQEALTVTILDLVPLDCPAVGRKALTEAAGGQL